jgi:hypothetical protein
VTEELLDAVLEATRQVPRDQWATAKYALADALGGAPEAHCEGTLDDERGILVRVGDALFFVRFEERGLAVTFLGSLRGGTLTETTLGRRQITASADEYDVRLRYESLGRHLSIHLSRSQFESTAPIRDVLRRWSSDSR